jgi:hypothetical protein
MTRAKPPTPVVGFDVARFLEVVAVIAERKPAGVDSSVAANKIFTTIEAVARADSLEQLLDYLERTTQHSPRALTSSAMLVALLAVRDVLPPGTPHTLKDVSLDDFQRGRGSSGILFHHGDLTISKNAIVPTVMVTGDLIVKGAICDATSPGGTIVVAGNIKARAIAIAGTLVTGGDVTLDESFVTLGVSENHPGVKPRPISIGGTLQATTLVIDEHVVTGERDVDETLEIPRDIERFIAAVRGADKLNDGVLRSKVLSGAKFLS